MNTKLTIVLSLIVSTSFAQLKPVSYQDKDQKLSGLSIIPAKPGTGKTGILILPAWKGIDDHAKKVAEELSKTGYYAFIADIYGEGHYPTDNKSAAEQSGFYKKNYKIYQERIRLALQQLIKSGANPNEIVVIGYCFGGTGAIEAARANFPVKGVVSFHGGLGKDPERASDSAIKPAVLVLHGADDPSVPPAQVLAFEDEMRKAKADWQLIAYANAVHAFTEPAAGNDNSKGAAYNEKADKRSWEHFLLFLKELTSH
ncbi:dienelactone hydrolase [Pedobacter antarcticus 4BY]|uniref:Dienelactone hydrolase n=2 Tax=Pedobacter antarcticus TaxID=34086 RepID=A0A081PF15_9SPHI|nr:dienelactone hydrolase family protein [Pedobacter antarcticus]KEQ29288.1 dienelactone hydrolase [Pedobacter antarcticus 4BY]SFE76169.1 Dienelactone hydrolase [Pedobacter antarcticus]